MYAPVAPSIANAGVANAVDARTVQWIVNDADARAAIRGPDILLTMSNRARIWIEATCAIPGQPEKEDSVPPPKFASLGEKPVVTSRPTEQMVLRIRNALAEKEAKFRKYLSGGVVAKADVLAIAINVHAVLGDASKVPRVDRECFAPKRKILVPSPLRCMWQRCGQKIGLIGTAMTKLFQSLAEISGRSVPAV